MRISQRLRRQAALALVSSGLLLGLIPAAALAQGTPAITGYAAGTQQATLTITGSGFGTTPATVTIDGQPATIVSWSDNSIIVNLSSQAGPGMIDITTAQGLSAEATFAGIERGYYTLTQAGVVTAHGNISTYGDLTTLGVSVTSPAIQLVPTADGQGYWILTQNGTVYGFGDATNFGSVGSSITAVGMAPLPSGSGMYVLSTSGTVYPLGQAGNYGSAPAGTHAAAIAAAPSGLGYWILASNGTVYPFGDAANLGSVNLSQVSSANQTTYPNGTLVRVAGTGPVFLVDNGVAYHIPSMSVLNGLGDTMAEVRSVPNLAGYTLGPPMIVPYPDGTVVEPQDSSTVYLVQQGLLHPLSSARLVQADGIPASLIETVPTIRANWPVGSAISTVTPYVPNGTLYRVSGDRAVYVLNNGTLNRIATGAVFNGMGLRWAQIHLVTNLPSYPLGPELTRAVPLLAAGTLWRSSGAVYVDQNGILRHIPTASLFNALGFSWKNVTNVPSLTGLKTGAELGSVQIPPGVATTPAVDLVPTPDGQGYWVLLQNGQIATVGDATSLGQLSSAQIGTSQALSLTVTPDGQGYTILTSTGRGYSFGDALAGPTSGTSISLAMSAAPSSVAPSQPMGFLSMMYGSFMPNYDGSYTTLVNNAAGISVIIPTWYYEQQNPSTLTWSPGTPPSGFANVVSQAHSENVQVWPMVGSISVAPFHDATAISQTVSQLVQAAVQNNYDGLTIDFEPSQFNGLSMAQTTQQFTNFIAQLGPALHSAGKKLMVDTYAAFAPGTPYDLPALAPYVDYFNIMTYGHFDSASQAGPDASVNWMQSVYQNAISLGAKPSQIIMGFGPYGDYWSFNNSGLDSHAPLGNDSYVSDAQVQQLLQANSNIVPVWDPTYQSEVFMTNEYVNSAGQWTVNPNGQAVAPTTTPLSTSDESTVLPQVKNLQGLLNYILVRYAVDNNQPVPSYLNLSQDGHYGPLTAEAVTQFQQDFHVSGATPGVYDAATQAALTQVIQQWNLGEYQYWVDTTQSMQNRVQQVAVADNLGGMAVWRLPFETNRFWPTLESTVSVAHIGQGGS